MLPRFLVVGTMKGGTSALIRGMRQHPAVFAPPAKEVHFFDEHFDEGLDWYRSQFAAAPPGAVVGEATPDYMYGSDVVDRVTASLPGARYLAILRNPVDRAYSHYWHNVRRGREKRSFEEALAAETEHGGTVDRRFAYLDRGRYAGPLRQIEASVGRQNMLVMAMEDLRWRRSETLRSAWEFIGVDPARGDAEEPKRSLKWHVRNRLSSGRRDRNSAYPAMGSSLRRELLSEMEAEVTALEDWWGRDLRDWKGPVSG